MGRLRTAPPRIQSAPQRLQECTGSWRTGKESSAARGYDYRWQKARARYLAEHPLCVMCEEDGKVTAATVVDHIIPHRGDKRLFWDSENNWQPLCFHCHNSVKAKEEAGMP